VPRSTLSTTPCRPIDHERVGVTMPSWLGSQVSMGQPGPALSPHLFIVCPHAEVGRLDAELAQYSRDLAAVVGRVVDRLHE
jgi:hypothetical protein